MPVRRDDITVEYHNGKRVVYFTGSSGPLSYSDFQMLEQAAKELGASVADPTGNLKHAVGSYHRSYIQRLQGLTQQYEREIDKFRGQGFEKYDPMSELYTTRILLHNAQDRIQIENTLLNMDLQKISG